MASDPDGTGSADAGGAAVPPASGASACSCPYGDTCKHAVAVALAYRSAVSQRHELPTAPDDDLRLALLEGEADDWDEDDWEA